MKKYQVKITLTHVLEVEAEDEQSAYSEAEHNMPSFTSSFDDLEMEITGAYES